MILVQETDVDNVNKYSNSVGANRASDSLFSEI